MSAPAPLRAPDLKRSGLLDPLRGFTIGLRGLGLVFSTPRLARLTSAVAAITALTLIGLAVGLWHAVPAALQWAWTPPDTWWARSLFTLLEVLSFLLLFVAGAVTLPMMLAAPLMDPISVATERLLGYEASSEGGLGRTLRETTRAVVNALLRLFVLLLGQAVLLLLLLIPGVGGPLWTVLSWLWTALWATAAYLDVPMARHLYPFSHEAAALKRRTGVCLGFGAAVALMLWVPLLNFFFVPVAIVGSTLLFRGRVASGDIPSPEAVADAAKRSKDSGT
ncbi:MAG: EI24 domain-containing protein [Deltaproteobacteria bacterium]|nr:EI24 domain-containing protein [Deltaproteobacteria bacterium]